MQQLSAAPSISLTDSRELYGSPESIELLHVKSPHCNAVVSIQGAQLLEFMPQDSQPWLWLSPKAIFSKGQPIRGGIPICAPWFGVNQQDPLKPKHGFVRTRNWQLVNITENDQGIVELTFSFTSDKSDTPLFPHAFSLKLVMTLAEHIHISFIAQNTGTETMPFSWALHSYFNVDNLKVAEVEGLNQHAYLDATQDLTRTIQHGPICFESEVDRVYENVGSEQVITGSPSLLLRGNNCPTAIVWNPGIKLAEKMADITSEHYDEYICVERGAAFANTWKVQPQQSITATLSILAST
nr:D-hexose-6-phosphate mutarotase [Alkalimarinus sediminis]